MKAFRFGTIVAAVVAAFLLIGPVSTASAQRRDFLTEQEVEIVREAQDIDQRIEVLVRMIDRRFHALGVNVNGWKDAGKVTDSWGELPTGTRTQLLNDIKRILQKAVDDIDNLAANPNAAPARDKSDPNARRNAKKDPQRFPIAVRNLAAAAERYMTPLKTELDRSADELEKGSIIDSIEFSEQIIAAVGKLPPPEPKKSKN